MVKMKEIKINDSLNQIKINNRKRIGKLKNKM